MKQSRLLLVSSIFAVFAVLSNWHVTTTFDRQSGEIESKSSAEGILLVVALIVVPVLLYQIHRLLREYLAEGVVIPKTLKLVDWRPCLLLFPLLVHWSYVSTGIAADGAAFTRTLSYGSDATVGTLISSILCIVLCQIFSNLASAGTHTMPAVSDFGIRQTSAGAV